MYHFHMFSWHQEQNCPVSNILLPVFYEPNIPLVNSKQHKVIRCLVTYLRVCPPWSPCPSSWDCRRPSFLWYSPSLPHFCRTRHKVRPCPSQRQVCCSSCESLRPSICHSFSRSHPHGWRGTPCLGPIQCFYKTGKRGYDRQISHCLVVKLTKLRNSSYTLQK